jgi:hypothetical protein
MDVCRCVGQRLHIHLVGGDLVDGVEEGRKMVWSLLSWIGGSRSIYVCCRFGVKEF